MDGSGQEPADGVADVQRGRGAEQLEDGGDPHQTEQAAAHQADDHGQDGVAPPAQAAGQRVHDAAEEVAGADDLHPGQPGGDDRFIGGIEVEQPLTGKVGTAAQHNADHHGAEQAVPHDAVEVVIPAGTHVLAGEGDCSLSKGVHASVDEALDVGSGRVARHDRGAEGIDRRLDDDIGEAEHGALQTGGQTDLQDLHQRPLVEAQMPQVEVKGAFFFHEQDGDHKGGDRLADDGGQRHARHAHLEQDDEDEVQHHIDDAGHSQTVQRAAGVAYGAQQRGVEVVQHGHRHPDEVDLQIQRRKVNDVFRAGHQFQQAACREKADKGQQHTADEPQRDRSLDGVLHPALVFGTKAAGCDDVRAQRKPYEQVDQQVDERTVRADSGQRGAAREPSDDHHVCSIEQELQNAGCCQRQGKQDDLFQQRAAGQIARPGQLCHESLPPCIRLRSKNRCFSSESAAFRRGRRNFLL